MPNLRIEPITRPSGLLITAYGYTLRWVIRDHLFLMDLAYTERRKWWKTEFFVPLPDGRDTGRIPEWFAKSFVG